MHEFDLNDATGAPHHYVVTPHLGGAGLVLVARLAELGVEPLARLATQALAADGALGALQSAVKGEPGADAALQGVATKLDLGGAARELRPLLADAPKLIRAILSNTTRDGKALKSDELGNACFDVAYSANYGELLSAVGKVVALNRFFPWPATS